MKHNRKYIPVLLAALLLLALAPTAWAAELSAGVDKASVQVGDQIQFTVTVSGEKLAVAQGVFTYDPALLAFVEGDGGAADGNIAMASVEKGGSASLSARVTMQALSAGEASVEFSMETLLGFDGDKQEAQKASASVSIAAAPVDTSPTPAPVNYAELGVKAENVAGASGDMYVWRSLEDVTIPSQYTETDIDYHGESVKGATVPDSDAPTLLYLSDAAGKNAGYYVYLPAQDSLYRYMTLSGASRTYILLQPDGSIATPEGFTETILTVDEKEITAWQTEDAQGSVYLVYARNPDGETGFYTYSVEDKSLQRYAVLPARPVVVELTPAPTSVPATPAPAPELAPVSEPVDGVNLTRIQFWALCGGAALLLVLLLISVISHAAEKARRKRRAAERRAAREMEAAQHMGE